MTLLSTKNIRKPKDKGLNHVTPVTHTKSKTATVPLPRARKKRTKLTELLYQVSLVPSNATLRDFFEVFEVVLAAQPETRITAGRGSKVFMPYGTSPDRAQQALDKALDICLEGHDELAGYIRNRSQDDPPLPGPPWYWYVFIRDARDKLRRVMTGQPVLSAGAPILKDGTEIIRVGRDFFAEALDDVDGHYLRECERADCRNIFFTKKSKKRYCTPKCTNVVRNRRFRVAQEHSAYRRMKTAETESIKKKRARTASKR